MKELIHGGDLYGRGEMLDFSQNSSPLGLPEGVKSALRGGMEEWSRYPDPLCRELIAGIALHEEVDPEWIYCGNGGSDIIFRIAGALAPRGALVPAPAFAEYERALRSAGCEVSFCALYEKDGFAVNEAITRHITSALDLMFLTNPHNPTGKLIPPELLEHIIKKCAEKKVTLVVDECFMPFVNTPSRNTVKGYLAAYPNLIVLGAFTKLYAMAGLRLGYLLCSDKQLLEKLRECTPPWTVSIPAQQAGIAALADDGYVRSVRELVKAEREYLSGQLKTLGMPLVSGEANYLFFKCHTRRDLAERLCERRILIRSCQNYRGLDGRFYRVAVKTHEQNERLVAALTEVMSETPGAEAQ